MKQTKKQTSQGMKRRGFLKKAAVGTAGVAAATVAAPAISQGRQEIVMVSTWPRDFPGLGTGAQRFAQMLTDMTDGRLNVQYFAGGERVKPFDSFDEVASGNAHIYHGAEYYWKGKHPGFSYFASVPFGMTALESSSWIRWMGGQELWDELGAEFGVKCFAAGNTGVQMGGWFRKEINSADDLKGLKFRMPGLGGDVLAKLGASPVSLPGSQIYENLVSGAIDGTEWVGPWNDSFLKFYEAAKYYYYPGMHESGTITGLGINKAWWDGLSKGDQLLIDAAATYVHESMYSEYNAKNGEFLAKLINEQGVELRKFSEDVADAFGEASEEVFEETRQHSDLAKRIDDSYQKSLRTVAAWMNIADGEYATQRNRVLGI
ncbi:MAG: TRAP transporter substrate-binding protein [Thiotrichales bacterium]|nr:TRAP transporter substrate-binding protein [Thiotrichales bacterium]MCY4349029.1 TRAP transporter substrate-binding protein [Thiotrichales bacterium]